MLRKTKDGRFSVRGESGVAEALRRREAVEQEIERAQEQLARTKIGQLLSELAEERDLLTEAIDGYVLDHYEAGDGFDDGEFKVTKVVSHRRVWNPEKLAELVPRGIFKNLVNVTVVPAKIDQYVREGKITLDAVADAFEETPNTPYTRYSRKQADAADEAASLEAKLA